MKPKPVSRLRPQRAASIAGAVLVWAVAGGLSQGPQDPYTGIPPGFDFPADEATLERFRHTENVSEMRRHAWYVWAGINQPAASGGPVWETWFPAETAFQPGTIPEALARPRQRLFETPRQLQPPPGTPQPEAHGQALLSFVLLNQESFLHIRGGDLFLQSKLNSINNSFPTGTPLPERKIAEFPRPAVVLKLFWQVVRQSGLTEQPIWDFQPTQPASQGNPPSTWARTILIDPSRAEIPAGETQDGKHVVPLANFYHFPLNTQALADSAGASLGDYAVLVCVHVTTKEIDDWVWATFWWHDRAGNGPFAADRPQAVEGVWRNYLMDVSYDTSTPREFDGSPNACMNPWLEARFPGGLASNCMTCHQRSTWPQVGFLPVTRGGLAPNDPFFAGKTKLDFLWSIGDRAN